MSITYTSDQVADIVRMAVERDRLERGAVQVVAPIATAVVATQPTLPAVAIASDMSALADFARSKEQKIKRRSAVQAKYLK
jgi:hypothetical protein